jgi:ATP-dependent RNA helicase DeaD
VVESLAEEFDVMDVAAAAVKMAETAAGAKEDEREIPSFAAPPPEKPFRPTRKGARPRRKWSPR